MPTTKSLASPLEPGAIAGLLPATALPAQAIAAAAPWVALDSGVAPNFTAAQPVLLPAGTVLRRVFGYPDAADPYPSWEVGSWWTRQPLPATEAEWRGSYAVEVKWNGGQCVVAWTTPQDIHAWCGPATPQAGELANGDPAPGYYLPGGGEQIYIPAAAQPVGAWVPGATAWTSPAPATSAAKTPKPPVATVAKKAAGVPTIVDLVESIGRLTGLLQAMAKEAKRIQLEGGALGFQAKRLTLLASRVVKFSSGARRQHLPLVLQKLTGLARHVHTQYPWSANSAAATNALRTVVEQADALLRAERAQ